jgi:hypothetical protein
MRMRETWLCSSPLPISRLLFAQTEDFQFPMIKDNLSSRQAEKGPTDSNSNVSFYLHHTPPYVPQDLNLLISYQQQPNM